MATSKRIRIICTVLIILTSTPGGECRNCYNCSSVNDHYCPEFMTSEDGGIVPYVSCDSIYDGRFCIKTTGVNGGSKGIRCFRCDDSSEANDCAHSHFHRHNALSDCADVFEAFYCIKTIQGVSGDTSSLGTTRFCSSRDMGNYCEYIRRPGDKLEYRSCVFTCQSDGCNRASSNINYSVTYALISSFVAVFTHSLLFCSAHI